MSEKLKTALSSVLAVSLVVSVMTASGFACLASVNNDDDYSNVQHILNNDCCKQL